MKKVRYTVCTEQRNGVVEHIGKSYVEVPDVKFKGGEIKWFDDTKLLKKGAK